MSAKDGLQQIDGRSFQKIALISDTHGPLHHDISQRLLNYDCVIHAGDLGAWSSVIPSGPKFYAVVGNNDVADKWPLEERGYLRKLHKVLQVALPDGDLVVIHGHQFAAAKTRHEKLRKAFPFAKAVVYGHSHRAIVDKMAYPWIINPGAAGYKRTYGGASYTSISINNGAWRVRQTTLND